MSRSLVLFLALALSFVSLSAAEWNFGAGSVTAHVTPGAATYWSCACAISGGWAGWQTIIEDTDGDGIVRWDYDRRTTFGVFTMIDGSSGEITTRDSRTAAAVPPVPFPANAFLRDENGRYSRFVMTSFADWNRMFFYVLWARPGVGAWGGLFALDGPLDDLPASPALMYDLRRMTRLGPSPEVPSQLLPDDIFIVQSDTGTWAASRVGPQLGEATGGGTIVLAKTEASEDARKATITLARIDGADGAVSVHYQTSDDTAHAGMQYAASSGTATFDNGQIFSSFEVPVLDDAAILHSQFAVTLSEPSGAMLGTTSFFVPIAENDTTPVGTIANASAPEGDGEMREVEMRVTLDHTAPAPVTLNWKVADAINAADVIDSGVLQLATGEKEKSFIVHYNGDNVWTHGRSYTVSIPTAVNAVVYRPALLTIPEDDAAPVVTASDITVSEPAGVVRIPLTFSEPVAVPYNINYSTADKTAKSGSDYTGTKTGALFFKAGATGVVLEIPIVNDAVAEGAESFEVTVIAFSSTLKVTVTIVDDDGGDDGAGRRRSMRH